MRKTLSSDVRPKRIDVLLFDAFSALCLANTIEPLRAANGFANSETYCWRFLTLTGDNPVSSSGMEVRADARLSDCSGDLLVVMPSYEFRRHATVAASRSLRAAARRYQQLAGFDTGAWLLADAGLLNGYRATIHWEELDAFSESYPEVLAERVRQVWDRDRITCSGALAAFETMLDFIEQDLGGTMRLQLASLFMSAEATGDQGAIITRNKLVARAIAVMEENVEHPLHIEEIAQRIGWNYKELVTRFKADTGMTPQVAYRRLRMLQARKLLLETRFKISEVALRCGYSDPSAFARAFLQEFATTPTALRRDAR